MELVRLLDLGIPFEPATGSQAIRQSVVRSSRAGAPRIGRSTLGQIALGGRVPKIAVPTRTSVAPWRMAASKS